MTKPRTGGVLRRLQRVLAPKQTDARGDAQLLDRFAGSGDEMAFELLVWRHRRLVMGVCRRVLGDYHDAEDAFQATFLTLARKASSIKRRECLATWLYQVSYRIALNARGQKQPALATDLMTVPSTYDPVRETDLHDLRAVLDDELSRLPAAYRAAIVLCYLQGKTYREASEELDLPLGTVSAHLSRARAMLRDALAQRGVVIPAATFASVLCGHAAVEAKSAALVDKTVQTILVGPQGWTRAAVLSQGVLRAMAIAKLKTVGVVTVVAILVATAFGAVAYHFAPATNHPQIEQAASYAGRPSQQSDEKKEDRKATQPALADRFRALVAAWKDDCCVRYPAQLASAKTATEREVIKPPDSDGWAKKMWALVVEAPNDPVVLEILCTIAVYLCWTDVAPLALDRLHRDFVKDPHLGRLCLEFAWSPDASDEKFLRAVLAEHPDKAVKARAAFALAYHLRNVLGQHGRSRQTETMNLPPEVRDGRQTWFPLEPEEEVRLFKEVEDICKDTIAGHAEEEWKAFPSTEEEMRNPRKTTMGKEAQAVLDALEQIDIRRLAVGQPAREISAIDSEGKPLKLSEFRGKVVLLNFGGQYCKPCRAMIPHERELVKRLEGRPFALLGIDAGTGGNAKEEATRLKEFLTSEKITWRVCSVMQTDASAKSVSLEVWNVQHIPVFYLIDDRGVIRQRIDGYTEGHILDAAIDGLVREAEERAAQPKMK